jgi:hypothetical protein
LDLLDINLDRDPEIEIEMNEMILYYKEKILKCELEEHDKHLIEMLNLVIQEKINNKDQN